ncbi:MAG: methylated-DNA--[protein]-cysteine S-methyltransferase [Actinomycetota bacterium]|nr:methylated-DNA--[protein]-cysteine S-methyltransferase [Actinomycetota bacterium]
MNTNDMKRLAPASDAASRSRQAAARLRELAADRHLLDVAIATVSSPIGDLLIAVTERGLVRVAFQGEDRDDVLEELSRRLSPRILESARASDEVRRELDQYFAGERTRFDVTVDRRLIGDFARKVLGATARVPFGRTTTYGEVATKIGSPRAARAVGNALGSNPIPIVIPCHRVLRSGGALGGYGGGVDRKQRLLRLEGAILTSE